jgi:N-acyl-L-homoserine lactone synthetase
MIISIQTFERPQYRDVLLQMFQTRKRVFFDTLNWDVGIEGDKEVDAYDDLNPVYLVWCDRERSRHYGSVRLMPTTGPTLLHDVFGRTFPDAAALTAPGIWEGTRMCLDERALSNDYHDMPAGRAFSLLLVALCEFALSHDIHTLISNYEPHFKRIYTRAGARLHELGRADGFGRSPVCCGAFEVSPDVLSGMRARLGLSEPVYGGDHDFSRTDELICAA